MDGVRHTIWRVTGADRDALVDAFARIPALYIADGHHRAASARAQCAATRRPRRRRRRFDLAVAFPHDQVQILPYNRTVKDLGGLTPDAFLQAVGSAFVDRARSARRRLVAATSRCTSTAPGTRSGRAWRRTRSDRDRVARRQRAAGSAARADSQDRRRADRQADRLRRRRARDGRARASGGLREGRGRVFAVSRRASPI